MKRASSVQEEHTTDFEEGVASGDPLLAKACIFKSHCVSFLTSKVSKSSQKLPWLYGRFDTVVGAWSKIGKLVQEYNDDTVKRTTEDLDTLLVFVGLFSAVVSAFLAASFQSLQENPADVTAQTLIIISQQLSSFSLQSGSLDSTQIPASSSSSFRPSTVSIIVNVLWLSCLATSLMISFGIILLKFILRLTAYDHRLTGISQPRPKEYRARYFRVLEETTAFRLALGLPMLLMFSLAMFLVGLVLFVIQLSHLVAGLTVLLVELPLWLWLISGVGPLLNVVVQHIQHGMNAKDPRFLDPEAAVQQQQKWDISVLIATERFVGQDDGTHLELTRQCLASAPVGDVYSYIRQILPERASHPWLEIPSLKEIPSVIFRELADESLTAAAEIVGDALERLLNSVHGMPWSDGYDEGVSFLAQIDPFRAIPMIPAIFGKLITSNCDFAVEVVSTLSQSGWKVIPVIRTREALSDLVQGVESALKLSRITSVKDLCPWLLSTVSQVNPTILQTYRGDVQSLLDHVAALMEKQPQSVPPSPPVKGYEQILPLVATLNAKCPGLVRGKIIELVTQEANRTQPVDEPPEVGRGRWAKLVRMSETVSRSRRRPDLMVRAA